MFVRIQLAQHIFQRGEEGVVFFLCADADAQMIRQLIAAERADDEAAFEQGLKAGFGIGAVVIGAAKKEVGMAGPDGKAEIAQALRQAARACGALAASRAASAASSASTLTEKGRRARQ